jgi:hypothetical protein
LESLYLIGSPDITVFKNVYRRYSNFSLVTRKKYLNDVTKFNYESKYKLQKEADFINGLTFNIDLSGLELDYPTLTIEYLMQILNDYNIKTDLLFDFINQGSFDVNQLAICFNSGDVITIDDYNNVVKPFLYEYIAYYINQTHNIKYILFDNINTRTNTWFDSQIEVSKGNDYTFYNYVIAGQINTYIKNLISSYYGNYYGIFYYNFTDPSGIPSSNIYKYHHLLNILNYIFYLDENKDLVDINTYTLEQFNKIESMLNYADVSGVQPWGIGYLSLDQNLANNFLDNLLISTYNNLLDCDNFEYIYNTSTYEGINLILSLIKTIFLTKYEQDQIISDTEFNNLTDIYNNLIQINTEINKKLFVPIQIYDVYDLLYSELNNIYLNTSTDIMFTNYLDNFIDLINFINTIITNKYTRNTDYRNTINYLADYFIYQSPIILNEIPSSFNYSLLLFKVLYNYYLDLEYYNYVDISGVPFNKKVYNMTNIRDIMYNDYFTLLSYFFPKILGSGDPGEVDINGNYFPFETNFTPNPLSPLRTYVGLTVNQKKQYFYYEYNLFFMIITLIYVSLDNLKGLVNYKIISGDISSSIYDLILKRSNEFIDNPLFTIFIPTFTQDPSITINDISTTEPFITLKKLMENNDIVIYFEKDLQFQLISILKYYIKKNYYIDLLLIQQLLSIYMYTHNSENYYRFGYYKTFSINGTTYTSDSSVFTGLYNNGIIGMNDNISNIINQMNVSENDMKNFFYLNYFNNQINSLNDSNIKDLNFSIINDYFNNYSIWSNLIISNPLIKNIYQNLAFNYEQIDLTLINTNYRFDASGTDLCGNPLYKINDVQLNSGVTRLNVYDYYFTGITNNLITQNLIVTNYTPLMTLRDIMDEIYNRFINAGLDVVDSSGNFRYSTLFNFKDFDELTLDSGTGSFTPGQIPDATMTNVIYKSNIYEGQILQSNQLFKNELYQEILLNIILKRNNNDFTNSNLGSGTSTSVPYKVDYVDYINITDFATGDVSGYDVSSIFNAFEVADLDYFDGYCNNYINSNKVGFVSMLRPENYIEFTINDKGTNYVVKLPFIIGIIQKIRKRLLDTIYNKFFTTNFTLFNKLTSLVNYVLGEYNVFDTYNNVSDSSYSYSSYIKNGFSFFNIKNDFTNKTGLTYTQQQLTYQRYSHGPSSAMSYINSKSIQNFNLTFNNVFDRTYFTNNVGYQSQRIYDIYNIYLTTLNVGSNYNNYYAPQCDNYDINGFIMLDASSNPAGDIENDQFASDKIVREYFFDTYYNGTYGSGASTDVSGFIIKNINNLPANRYYRSTSLLKTLSYFYNSSFHHYYNYDPTNSYLYPLLQQGFNLYAICSDKVFTFINPVNSNFGKGISNTTGYITIFKDVDNNKPVNSLLSSLNIYSNSALLEENLLYNYTNVFNFYSRPIDNTQLTSVTDAVNYYYNSIGLILPFDASGVKNDIINNPEINVIGTILYDNPSITAFTTGDIQYCSAYDIIEKLGISNQYTFNVDLSGNIINLLSSLYPYYSVYHTTYVNASGSIMNDYNRFIGDDGTQKTRGKYIQSMFYNKYITSYFNNLQNKSDVILYILLQLIDQNYGDIIINNIDRNNHLIRDKVSKYYKDNIINSESIIQKYIVKYKNITNKYNFNINNNLDPYFNDYGNYFANKYNTNIYDDVIADTSGNLYVNNILDISFNYIPNPTDVTNITNWSSYIVDLINTNIQLLINDDGFTAFYDYLLPTTLANTKTAIVNKIVNDKNLPFPNANYTTTSKLIYMHLQQLLTSMQIQTIDYSYTPQDQIRYNELNNYIPTITTNSQDASNNVVYESSELDKLFLRIINTNSLSEIPYDWVNKLGFRIFDYINIKCDDILIDEYKPELLSLYSKLNLNGNQLQIFPKFIEYNPYDKNNIKLTLPMDFWFRDVPLPMINVLYSDIYVGFKVTDLSNILILDDPLITVKKPPKLKINVLVDYVYIEKEEREKLAKSKLEFLIQRYRYGGIFNLTTNNIINNKIKVQFRLYDPTKYILWRLKVKNNDKKNWDINTEYKISNYVKLYFNGSVREQAQEGYFNNVQPYCRYLGSLDNNEFIHSYALFPKILQPSGSANLTNIEEIWIEHELTDEFNSNFTSSDILEIEVFSLSYQLLRLISGIMAPAFLY